MRNLRKSYPAFRLQNVSFSLAEGKITGFVGRNGAGKSTTLRSLFHIVHPDGGDIRFFGKDFAAHELEIKQRVGFVTGGIDYYPHNKRSATTRVTHSLYAGWDDAAYARCLSRFELEESKTPAQLSTGMKIKYALTLALSHRAELLILDEPTSGLDPVSRDELLDLFLSLCDEGVTILFSTHIVTDLQKCADRILYIRKGAIQADSDLKPFVAGYRLAGLPKDGVTPRLRARAAGIRRTKDGCTALLHASDAAALGLPAGPADLEPIFVHLDRGYSI